MDTRLTKFKYSLFTKGLCLILASLMFFSFAYTCIVMISATQIYGFEEYFSEKLPDFYNSYGFRSQFNSDNYRVRQLITSDKSAIEAAFKANEKAIIEDAVNNYLAEKAEIIENELRYAVDNYDESYFNYEYTADTIVIPETTELTAQEQSTDLMSSENKIPKNIEAAQKILENCSGRQFLDYETLVRSSAFSESEYHYSNKIHITTSSSERYVSVGFYNHSGYDLNEAEARKLFLEQYNNIKSDEMLYAESETDFSLSVLSQLSAFKYYVTDTNGKIYTNVKDITAEEFRQNALNNEVYILFDDSDTTKGLDAESASYYKIDFNGTSGYIYYVYIDNNEILNYCNDSYGNLLYAYDNYASPAARVNIIIAIVTFILSIIFLIALLCLCGHKNGEETPVLAAVDKIPTDIHFLISVGATISIAVFGLWVGLEIFDMTSMQYLIAMYAPFVMALLFTVSFLILTEWLASVARMRKSGAKFFTSMLICRFFRFIRGSIRRIIKGLKILNYRPGQMDKKVVTGLFLYILGNIILMILALLLCIIVHAVIVIIAYIWLAVAYNVVMLCLAINYIRNLDKIICASCKHETVDFGNEKVPASLQLLASNLTNTNEALQEAIEKAIKDEQMKTELITNVSHDLKTPLTSLISYSDLLEKCDISDETAKKYIGVIHTQSIKLKRLIEDLIEASKVSTGNVTLNKTRLNLSELAMQAIAEFAPEMEKNGNEIRFTEPDTSPSIYADGSKTYRILSNLLNNARKYSAPDTRVYISVYTDGTDSYFEIKNISSEPLNIEPEELTERFVRGDKSRSKEGNGLGLSIAKDLCALQNGELRLSIDGDLFKAIVKLPAR